MNFFLDKKTGFNCLGDGVRVYNADGSLFYEKANVNFPNKFSFNLPRGAYVCFDNIQKRKEPVFFKLEKLPPKEKKVIVKQPVIIYGENKNKASIDIQKHLIIIDNQFKESPKANQVFLLCHELGHYYYTTESYCDRFARNKMLLLGFNPSQISLASVTSLNCKIPTSKKRISIIHNLNKKNNGKKL
jgi:hypothetical protein